MEPITELDVTLGQSAHLTAVVLDQHGNPMTAVPTISDPGPNSGFTPDAGTTAAGTVEGLTAGTDTITATFGSITATLPVVVKETPVATSIVFTTP